MLLSVLAKWETNIRIILDFQLNLYVPGENAEAKENIWKIKSIGGLFHKSRM